MPRAVFPLNIENCQREVDRDGMFKINELAIVPAGCSFSITRVGGPCLILVPRLVLNTYLLSICCCEEETIGHACSYL